VRKLRQVVEKMDDWELAGECACGVGDDEYAGPWLSTRSCSTHGARLRRRNACSDSFAAFERAVYATKSFAIALALCKGRLTADNAADASHVEVRAQIELWGEVEDSESAPTLIAAFETDFDSP
jgi:hypothetical protein